MKTQSRLREQAKACFQLLPSMGRHILRLSLKEFQKHVIEANLAVD